MGLYKEEAYEIESIAKLQKQIYPDAADFGVPVSGYNDDIVKRMQEVIDILKMSFNIKRNFTEYGTGKTSTTEIFIPWEKEGHIFLGTIYKIEYVHIKPKYRKKSYTDYITVESKQHQQIENPFRGD